jgi:hypothetical protein
LSYGFSKPEEAGDFFPDLSGWSKDESPRIYDSQDLYKYIDGAADLYINYEFQRLFTLSYERGEEQGITVDVYRQSTPRNGFGIYSRERPTEGKFLSIGTEGYYDQGILNYVLGDYYVKIAGYYLGDEDEALLTSLAQEVAGRLGEGPGFPKPLSCLPDSGRIAHSERYIAADFLGHAFLHSAYTADYEAGGQDLELFIIEAGDEGDALGMLESYVKLAKDKGAEVTDDEGYYRFRDPYYSSGAKVNLMQSGRYLWGLFSDSAALTGFYLDAIGAGLAKASLLDEHPAER